MAGFTFDCPHCNQSLETSDDLQGQEINCPSCNGTILIEGVPESPPLPKSTVGRLCNHCQARVTNDAVICVNCGTDLRTGARLPTVAPPRSSSDTSQAATKGCPYCGEDILAVAIKCKHCQSDLRSADSRGYSTLSRSAPQTGRQNVPAIWNPNAAVNWSLALSPAFGMWLHAANWRALGHSNKAIANLVWFWMVIAASVVTLAASFFTMPDWWSDTVRAGFLLILFGWYFTLARSQVAYVKKQLGERYTKRGWGTPICIGALCVAVYFGVACLIAGIQGATQSKDVLSQSGPPVQPQAPQADPDESIRTRAKALYHSIQSCADTRWSERDYLYFVKAAVAVYGGDLGDDTAVEDFLGEFEHWECVLTPPLTQYFSNPYGKQASLSGYMVVNAMETPMPENFYGDRFAKVVDMMGILKAQEKGAEQTSNASRAGEVAVPSRELAVASLNAGASSSALRERAEISRTDEAPPSAPRMGQREVVYDISAMPRIGDTLIQAQTRGPQGYDLKEDGNAEEATFDVSDFRVNVHFFGGFAELVIVAKMNGEPISQSEGQVLLSQNGGPYAWRAIPAEAGAWRSSDNNRLAQYDKVKKVFSAVTVDYMQRHGY